jgi:hypothetical protein
MNIPKIYESARKIAKMKRRARRVHIARICRENPYLNEYDLRDIIALYANAEN